MSAEPKRLNRTFRAAVRSRYLPTSDPVAILDGYEALEAEVDRLRSDLDAAQRINDAATAFVAAYYQTGGPTQDAREALRVAVGIDNPCVACKGSGCACHPYGQPHPAGLIGWSPCRTCGGTRAALAEHQEGTQP